MTVGKGVAVRRRRIRAGPESLIGHLGVVRNWADPTGCVMVDGALWRACRSLLDDEDPQELHAGDKVVVDHLDGLTVAVRPRGGMGDDPMILAIVIVLAILAGDRVDGSRAPRSGCFGSTNAAWCSGSGG